MKDLFDLFVEILSKLNLVWAGGWIVALFSIGYIFRKPVARSWGKFLNWIATSFENELGYRRFEPEYRKYIREYHLHLKIVGLRTEEERRPKIKDAYVPIGLVPRGGNLGQTVSVEQITHNNAYNLILGDPGAGKSTILDYLTVEFTKPQVRVKSARTSRRTIDSPCPIYIPLRRCQQKNETFLDDVLDPTTEILPTIVRKKMSKNFILRCLNRGHAILLLDGLDEVANQEAYNSIIEKVNDFIQLYPKNKIIITCRKAGWRGGLHPAFQVFSALPLDSQQQYEFVHKWYAAILQYTAHGTPTTEDNLRKRAEREANQLLTLLRTKERLRELASNPLMLSLICLVHKQRKDLPRGRAALYENCLDILLGLWDIIDKELEQEFPTTEQKKLLLRRIAYRMQISDAREINRHDLEDYVLEFLPAIDSRKAAADIVRQIEVRSGLMVERSIDKLTFSHLTFQEFLVVEYIRNELNERIDIKTITDWTSWREPILLMGGLMSNPSWLIADLYAVQPLLALYAITEAEHTRIDLRSTDQIVGDVIKRVYRNEIGINELIPALVDLLSVEGNPFEQRIIEFIHKLIGSEDVQYVNSLIESLSKNPTREAARIILTLLTRYNLKEIENIFTLGLARIGDPAIQEAIAWRERGGLAEEQVFQIVVECQSLYATKTLWTRYELQPPNGYEFVWAKTWAQRLANYENDQAIRPFTTSGPGVSDVITWPYKENDGCAVAAIIQKASDILFSSFPTIWHIYRDIDLIKSFSLRIQIPILLQAYQRGTVLPESDVDIIKETSIYSRYKEGKFAEIKYELSSNIDSYVQNEFGFKGTGSKHVFFDFWFVIGSTYSFISEVLIYRAYGEERYIDKHLWYTLGTYIYKLRKNDRTTLRKLTSLIGIVIEGTSIILVTLGIRALLPPNGTYLGFWLWLPLWAKIIIPIAILTIPILTMTLFDFGIEIEMYFMFLLLYLILIIFPSFYYSIIAISHETRNFEKIIVTTQVPKRPVKVDHGRQQ